LQELRKSGLVKRAECYWDEPFIVNQNEQYLLYMVSFGDFQKGKLVRGRNPLAEGLGVCLFDYVYIFMDGTEQVICGIFSGEEKNGKQDLEYGQKGIVLPSEYDDGGLLQILWGA
jgi:hypothetical protein